MVTIFGNGKRKERKLYAKIESRWKEEKLRFAFRKGRKEMRPNGRREGSIDRM